MANNKEYHKKYWQKTEVKESKRLEMRETYASEQGQEYEQKKRRTHRSRYVRGKYAANKRGKPFSLSFEKYVEIINSPCFYCNIDISNETGIGLDRQNNDSGYHSANVVPCCKVCNRIRSKSMSSEEFLRQTIINGRRKP